MKTTIRHKFLSVFMCVVLLIACVPISTQAAQITPAPTSAPTATPAPLSGTGRTIADPKTLDTWETLFAPTSSRYSGGVYIDKSVYTAYEAKNDAYFSSVTNSIELGKDNFGNDHFMIALSALGSNSEVLGYSYLPTDTVLILDASTSMGVGGAATSSIDDMVAGANNAIKRLLALNNYNRVGVVIYNGSSSVLLPLDHYTSTNASGNILEYGRTNSTNRIYIASNVLDGNNNPVSVSYVAQSNGTYTQGGIYEAAQLLLNADTVIEDGKIQGGTNRIPIMVLMSDGEPSYRTTTGRNNTITRYNAASNANADRSAYREDEITAFSTMLTAAWAEGEVSAHYGEDARFYTLGYALSANHSYALNVLNPLNANNPLYSSFSNYANTYLALAQGETGRFNNDAFRVTRQSNPANVTSLDYVDRYWAASNANLLNSAFDSIVDEIIIQSRYYSTLVSSGDYTQDGFISLTDEIGTFMEVKDIEGVYIGEGKLVSGGMFAEFATTGSVADYDNANYDQSQLNGFENEILSAISKRLNISLSTAHLLIESAKESGFISYTSPNEFSNYIAWYADENNTYLAPYTNISEHANTAKYIVRSYFYMGDVNQNHVTTSMLYTSVRVREDISTGRQIVDMDIPAALLPMTTYTITVTGDELNDANLQGLTCTQKNPISLLFEVGIDSDINKVNLTEKVTDAFREDSNGDYVFYTNRWRDNNGNAFVRPNAPDPHVFHHGIINTTVSQFIPSLENERFYYTENKQILDGNHQVYTGSKPAPGGTYYVEYKYVEGTPNSANIVTVYDEVAQEVLNLSGNIIQIQGKEGWFISKGTPQFYFGDKVHGEQGHLHKTQNPTQTLQFSDYPQVVYHDEEEHHGYHILNYHGNNGLVKVTPTQGIKLSKTVTEPVAGAPTEFAFQISLPGISEGTTFPLYIDRGNGNLGAPGTATVEAGSVIHVSLSDGQTAYITDIPVGTGYSVSENYNNYYSAFGTNTSGTVAQGTYSEVSFENRPMQFGSLLVEKDVNHPFSTISQELLDKEFDITVTFSGSAQDLAQITSSNPSVVSSDNGHTFNFKLKSGHDVLFEHIPVNVQYSVVETTIPNGFTLVTAPAQLSGTISGNTQSEVLLVNNYSPSVVTPNITISGEKNLTGRAWDNSIDNYQIALQEVSFGGQDAVAIGSPIIVNVAKNDQGSDYTIDMSTLSYSTTGTHSYVVYEVFPDTNRVPDVSYDPSFAIFSFAVKDNGSGTLYIDQIDVYQNSATLSGDATNGWTIQRDFNNTYLSTNVRISASKQVVDDNSTPLNQHLGGIVFALYDSTSATTPVYHTLTDEHGLANFVIQATQSAFDTSKSFYLKEELPPLDSQVIGMTYDTSFKYVVTIDWSDASASAPEVKYYYFDPATNAAGAEITDINASPLVITNNYDDSVVSAPVLDLSGKKTINQGTIPVNDSYVFELYETDATFNITGLTPIQTKTVDAHTPNSTYNFDGVTFDSEGTKYLVIREQTGNVSGITYDNAQYHITVDVSKTTDNNKTVLAANVLHMHKVGHGDVNPNELHFNNTYQINDVEEILISGTKTLTGRSLVEGEFAFGLFNLNDLDHPILTALVDKDSKFAFDAIECPAHNVDTFDVTLNYVIKEIKPNGADMKGISYNTDGKDMYDVSIQIKDDGQGGLTKAILLDGQPVSDIHVAFTNGYTAADTTLKLSGVKTLENKADGTFTFELYETTDKFQIADGSTPLTATTQISGGTGGNYEFNLAFTQGDRGYHYYVLREQVPTQTDGIMYDAAEYHITVNALDNGHGEMEAHIMSIESAYNTGSFTNTSLNFTNRYEAKTTEYLIQGTKSFTNGTLAAELFEFVLSDGQNEIATVKNAADGTFAFPVITLENAGDYIYYVSEANGGQTINRISYDNSVYKITIPVKDDNVGNLYVDTPNIVTEKIVNNTPETATGIHFTNVYHHGGGGGGGHHPQPDPTATPVPSFVSPQTGDNSNLGLWVTLMLISGLGIIGIAFLGKSKKDTNPTES